MQYQRKSNFFSVHSQAVGSVKPSRWCVLEEEVEELQLIGQGFTGNLVMEDAFCSFRINGDNIYGEEGPTCTLARF